MRIKRVTVIKNPGEQIYQIGFKCNEIKIHCIEDHSQEYPDGIDTYVIGYTEEGETLFEIMNAPVIIEYEKEK